MPALKARRWTPEEFAASREEWQRLLSRSGADPLFMSWEWIDCWWRNHAAMLGGIPCVLGVYSADGDLHGVAPFYLHAGTHRRVFRTRRLELMGNSWRDPSAVFSEYLDLITAESARADVCAAVSGWLNASGEWDELLLCNVRAGSVASHLADATGASGSYLREVESQTGWKIPLPGTFEAYTSRLTSNARRKVVHQRAKLPGLTFGVVAVEDRGAALDQLEAFVSSRWGGNGGRKVHMRFHADLLGLRAGGPSARLTELRRDGRRVSVMLNLRVGNTEYYLQSGFDASHANGWSPGYLHLGYAIEAACRDGIQWFDLLAGRGMHRDYKRDFAAVSSPLNSFHVVRRPLLRAAFRGFDRLKNGLGLSPFATRR